MSNTILSSKQIEDISFKRYVLSIVSGQESLVVQNLQETISKNKLKNQVEEIFFPEIKTVSIKKNGERKITSKKLHPGYVYVKSMMNDKIWYILRNTPGVRLIIGSEIYPTAVDEKEMDLILKKVKESEERMELDIPYKVGDIVKLRSSEMGGIEGKITFIDKENGQIQVQTNLMGRETNMSVSLDKIEKVVN